MSAEKPHHNRYEQDRLLIEKFVRSGSDDAFAALFDRYHGFVTAVCLREPRDSDLAADAAQSVFIALARKAHTIRRGTALSAWLFQAARFAATDLARRERSRTAREQRALEALTAHECAVGSEWERAIWLRIDPHLNDALAG